MAVKTTTKEKVIKKDSSKKSAKVVKKTPKMEAVVYNTDAKESGKLKLPETVFNVVWNGDLVHQVIVSERANARVPVAHTKDRSDVRGGGKKPWQQKGTGRARHGSIRSPLWRGGGVTFGPRNERSFKKKVNKKMRAKALYTVLSQKYRDNEILFVDDITIDIPKTTKAMEILKKLSTISGFEMLLTRRKNATLITFSKKNIPVYKSFSNFGNIVVDEWRNLTPLEILSSKYLVLTHPKEAIAFFEEKLKKLEK